MHQVLFAEGKTSNAVWLYPVHLPAHILLP